MSWASPIIAIALMFGRTGRRADMGRRPVEGYLHGRKGRVSAAVFPKGQQIRRTAQHPAHPRMRRYGTELAVRGHALRAVFLSNPVAVDRVAVSDHVPADVQLGHRTALQNAETATPVPDRKRQRRSGSSRTRLLRLPCWPFILSFIPPSQISTGSNTVWFSVLIIGCIIVVGAPFIIYASRKPSWQDPEAAKEFQPFSWENNRSRLPQPHNRP